LVKAIITETWVNQQLEPDWPVPGNEVLGFRLLRELGRGAFARVFLAEQPAVGGRLVVLKVSRINFNEAQTLGRLEHRNVVAVHSVGHDLGRRISVLCMPFLGAATLGDVKARAFAGATPPRRADVFRAAVEERALPELAGRVPPVRCEAFRSGSYVDAMIDVARQLAEALAVVHAGGVCHLDLKPSNVLLSRDGRPMLLDFNLSDDPHAPEAEERFGGTLPYMSPEQLRAVAPDRLEDPPQIDFRSDLYSLGVVLYELLTDRHPCGSLNDLLPADQFRQELLNRQGEGVRPLRGLNPDIDRALEKIILRCLAFDPADRFASAAELVEELKKYQSPARRAVRWATRHPVVLSVALAAILCGVAGGVYQSQLPPYADRQYEQGMKAYKDKDFPIAIDCLTNALDQPSPPADAYFYRGRAFLHVSPPDYRKALEDFLRTAEIAAADPLSKEGYGKAVASAAHCYHQLAKEDPANATEYRQNAVKYCDKAIEEGYARPIMYNNKGFAQAALQGASQNALRSFTRAIQLDPRLQVAYHNRARIDLLAVDMLGARGYEPKAGIRDIEEAIRLGPANPELLYDAFCMYMKAFLLVKPHNPQYLDRARAEIRELSKRGWLSQEMAGDVFFQDNRARLGVAIRDADLKGREQLPSTLLFLDPVGD
jgi:tetratricopeptide (TPR) repeat protein